MAFTTFEICKKMDLRKDRFREWVDRGFIKPSIQRAQGRGTKNLFSRTDLYLIETFRHLITCGFGRKEAGRRVAELSLWLDQNRSRRESAAIVAFQRKTSVPYLPFTESAPPFSRKDNKMYDSEDREIYPGVLVWFEGEEAMVNFREGQADIDDVLLVNFKKVRERVDTAFSLKA